MQNQIFKWKYEYVLLHVATILK